MAYTAKTAFEARVSNNEWDNLVNVTGQFQSGSPAADADCSAGFLCVRGENLPCEGFPGVVNENAFYMTAAAATVNIDDVIYACNTYDSKKVSDGVNAWHVGHATLGLGIPAGERGTFTEVVFNNKNVYRFGVGNTTDEGAGSFYTIANGLLAPANAAPETAGSIYFKAVGTGNFVEGNIDSFGYVDLRACKVSA